MSLYENTTDRWKFHDNALVATLRQRREQTGFYDDVGDVPLVLNTGTETRHVNPTGIGISIAPT